MFFFLDVCWELNSATEGFFLCFSLHWFSVYIYIYIYIYIDVSMGIDICTRFYVLIGTVVTISTLLPMILNTARVRLSHCLQFISNNCVLR